MDSIAKLRVAIALLCIFLLVACGGGGGGGGACETLRAAGGDQCANEDNSLVFLEVTTDLGVSTCSGTFISLTSILTAHHCFQGSRITSLRVVNSDRQIVDAEAVLYNPNYAASGGFPAFDTAIVKVPASYAQSTGIVPRSVSFDAPIVTGDRVFAGGFGLTDNIDALENFEPILVSLDVIELDRGLIASTAVNGNNCKGDSGGPVFLDNNNAVVGVVSIGQVDRSGLCVPAGGAIFFADVAVNRDFILSVASDVTVVD